MAVFVCTLILNRAWKPVSARTGKGFSETFETSMRFFYEGGHTMTDKTENPNLETLKNAKPVEFQKQVAEELGALGEAIMMCLNFTTEQRDVVIETVVEKFKQIDADMKTISENFDHIRDEMRILQDFAFMNSVMTTQHLNGPMSYDNKKGLAEMLSIDFDSLRQELEVSKPTSATA